MMKRLPVVAIGVALCALATGVEARSDSMRLGAYDGYRSYADGDWDYVRPHNRHRSVHEGSRRHTTIRSGRRHAVRGGRRGRMAARRAPETPLIERGIMAFARPGTSRACL